MFDYVRFEAKCFLCGTINTEWQTKSAKDGEDLMRLLEVSDVGENFYQICDGCGAWNEYDVMRGKPRLKTQKELNEYERVNDTEREKAKELQRSRGEAAPNTKKQ